MNVLVLAPHPDDESIGCGGAIRLHKAQGDSVAVAFLTSGEHCLKHLAPEEAWRIRETEATEAANVLGIGLLRFLRFPDWFLLDHIEPAADALRQVIDEVGPDLIYLPHRAEWHPDHKAALPILRRALQNRPLNGLRIRSYEIWTPLEAHDHVLDISSVMVDKLRAVRGYRSQLNAFRYDHAIRGLNRYRGIIAARCRYAEVFQNAEMSS